MIQMLYPPASAATYLGVSTAVLSNWRRRKVGPKYVLAPGGPKRKMVLYPLDGLDSFRLALEAREERIPRPFPGRMPKAKKARRRQKAAPTEP